MSNRTIYVTIARTGKREYLLADVHAPTGNRMYAPTPTSLRRLKYRAINRLGGVVFFGLAITKVI